MKHEPVAATATITAVVTALIGLLVAFGIDINETQQVAILSVVAVVAPLVVIVARRWTTPNAKVAERVEGSKVIAGEANELVPTGDKVRDLGEAPIAYRAVDDDNDGRADYTPEGR